MHSDSPLDVIVKGSMIKDMLNLTGIHLPHPKDVNNATVKTCHLAPAKVTVDPLTQASPSITSENKKTGNDPMIIGATDSLPFGVENPSINEDLGRGMIILGVRTFLFLILSYIFLMHCAIYYFVFLDLLDRTVIVLECSKCLH